MRQNHSIFVAFCIPIRPPRYPRSRFPNETCFCRWCKTRSNPCRRSQVVNRVPNRVSSCDPGFYSPVAPGVVNRMVKLGSRYITHRSVQAEPAFSLGVLFQINLETAGIIRAGTDRQIRKKLPQRRSGIGMSTVRMYSMSLTVYKFKNSVPIITSPFRRN